MFAMFFFSASSQKTKGFLKVKDTFFDPMFVPSRSPRIPAPADQLCSDLEVLKRDLHSVQSRLRVVQEEKRRQLQLLERSRECFQAQAEKDGADDLSRELKSMRAEVYNQLCLIHAATRIQSFFRGRQARATRIQSHV